MTPPNRDQSSLVDSELLIRKFMETPRHHHFEDRSGRVRGLVCVSPECWDDEVVQLVNGHSVHRLHRDLYEIGWVTGAEDEARAREEGLTEEQYGVMVTLDSMFRVWDDRSAVESLAVATRIFSTDLSWWERLKIAWRVLV